MKIGIFDSGIGGEVVAIALQKVFPEATLLTVNDHKNVPYGSRSSLEILSLTETAIQSLLEARCDIIVIACNTATALALPTLRVKYSDQLFIGIEPMIKTAATKTKTNTIAVCATPATLASKRYAELVASFGKHLTIIEPDCSDWASMIEHNSVNKEKIAETVQSICKQSADVIVLGCTHYHWIKELIEEQAAGKAVVLEPSEAIGRQVKALLNLT